jgi:alkylation response protein AidB-like acyl-CoA dehydrogenase
MRYIALRMLGVEEPGVEASISKLLWSGWHQRLGELAMAVRGEAATVAGADGELDELQRLFLFTRADTIYGGSDEIQRGIIATRMLGLPRP